MLTEVLENACHLIALRCLSLNPFFPRVSLCLPEPDVYDHE